MLSFIQLSSLSKLTLVDDVYNQPVIKKIAQFVSMEYIVHYKYCEKKYAAELK